MPASFDIPAFPRHLQTKTTKNHARKIQRIDTMIRVLYEAVAQYTMYVSVLKANRQW